MLMRNAKSGDQFGVSYNYDYVLLQVRECAEDFEESRIKLTIEDAAKLIEDLEHYKNRVEQWKNAVGPKLENETDHDYTVRVIVTARENNYFVGKQEE
jgi:hypothetical protein